MRSLPLVDRGAVLKTITSPPFVWGVASAALIWHATRYDFFCDDGFIALRYSKTLLTKGELAYNPGERVEGFTSPLWVMLVALLGAFGGSLVTWAKILGAASALGTLAVSYQLWRHLAPQHSPRFAYVVMGLLAVSPPFAAWTLGGLETPLFALGVSSTLLLLARAHDLPTVKRWLLCGIVAALSGLARPEGMGLAALCVGMAMLQAVRSKQRAVVFACGLPVVFLLGGYIAFRLVYYGYPFPNTYYVKTSGGDGLARRGLKYVAAMARQFGWSSVCALGLAIVLPAFNLEHHVTAAKQRPSFGVLAVWTRVLVVGFVIYLVRIGGDFLDLYRFWVPVLPLVFCLIVSEALNLWSRLREAVELHPKIAQSRSLLRATWGLRAVAIIVVGGLVFSYSQHALWMAVKTLDARWYSEPSYAPKRPSGVEPIKWTRKAALNWAALGRVLAKHAKRGDSMAMGAAGAAPYTAKLPNLDLFGLTDVWVSHHGRAVGSRPGHQRFATNAYILEWKPTFLFLQPSGSAEPKADTYWNSHGYTSATLKVDKRQGALKTHYVSVLVRKNRVKSLRRHHAWKFL